MQYEISNEQTLIAGTYKYWDETQAYKDCLTAEDFSVSACRTAWGLFQNAYNIEGYQTALNEKKLLSKVWGWEDLDPIPSALPYYVNKVFTEAQKRRMRRGFEDAMAGDNYLSATAELIQSEQGRTPEAKVDPERMYTDWCAYRKREKTVCAIQTGLKAIDSITGGLKLNSVSILAAYPSTGKTALALNMAAYNAKKGKKVLFISLEMGKYQLIDRLAAAEGNLSYECINRSQIDEVCVAEAVRDVITRKSLFEIVDNCTLIEPMAAKIGRIKPDLVIVDFVQMCHTQRKTENRTNEIEYIMGEFKRIARLYPCHILLLSQMSREATKSGPDMFTLKGSSALEQGGDVVFILDRPNVKDKSEHPAKATVKIAKNKYGANGEARLFFEGEYQRFRDLRSGEYYPAVVPADGDKPF